MIYENLVSEAGLTQKHLIHGDKELFQHELKTIFARNWLFLTHDSLIPSPGDYVTAKMGVDARLWPTNWLRTSGSMALRQVARSLLWLARQALASTKPK